MTPLENDAARQLDSFIARYRPELAAVARQSLAHMRALLPCALELVYDNYNALAVGFGPSEKSSEAIFSIAVYPHWVTLFFLQGAHLKDPNGLLAGSGTQVRSIRLESADDLLAPEVRALMLDALAKAKVPLSPATRHRILIKSISAKQRPRR
jgi:hypothetical protein